MLRLAIDLMIYIILAGSVSMYHLFIREMD